ncbi:anti sigma factor C-terminal domain-containing protein [Calidifontibacillus oryziterrae]|uniref:anti sigma factor C-terminal domain-containing protein n=1 Tax=Calidifontibacillus oryziterrae TaxID=1191699 RepID=UPI0003601D8B|nr:anti sigma factor C-terminal domain-containing protein [Calidifontibacillus oryziterrae]
MMNNEQKDFSFDNNQIKKLMRKAKFWSTIKIIVITIVVTPIILSVLWYGLWKLTLHSAQKTIGEIVMFNEISGPNVHISHQTYNTDWLGGDIKIRTYKVLGNRPHIWEPIEGSYNLFGTFSRNYGSYGSIQFERSESLAETHQFDRFNAYTGDRELFFYHPDVAYDVYKDSISELEQIEKTNFVELGLSFDQAYSYNEIQNKLPSNVQVVWWWVDAYPYERIDFFQQDQDTISADYPFIYGFHAEQFKEDAYGGIDSFITSLERLQDSNNFKWEAGEAYNALIGDNGKLEQSDVQIIGAIVTGTPEQLKSLQGLPFIKGSTLGVIAELK